MGLVLPSVPLSPALSMAELGELNIKFDLLSVLRNKLPLLAVFMLRKLLLLAAPLIVFMVRNPKSLLLAVPLAELSVLCSLMKPIPPAARRDPPPDPPGRNFTPPRFRGRASGAVPCLYSSRLLSREDMRSRCIFITDSTTSRLFRSFCERGG